MRLRSALALILLGGTVALTALAYASPQDPVWVEGVFDDGDYDDVVTLIVSSAALLERPASACADPVLIVLARAPQTGEKLIPSPPVSLNPVRAPPSA